MNELVILLSAIVIFQQIFYSKQIHKLIDKLMSRNYGEFKQAETLKRDVQKVQVPMDIEDTDINIMQDFQR